MEFMLVDIDGMLTGTIVDDMSLSQQAIWWRLIGVAGKGHGRVGFIERAPGVGFSRDALYAEVRVYLPEHKKIVDDTLEVCVGGNDPRITIHETGVIEINKWDKYQLIPKGTLRDSLAERRNRNPKAIGNPNWRPDPTSPTIQDAKEKKQAAVSVYRQEQTVVDSFKDRGLIVVDPHTGERLLTTKEKGDNHNDGTKEGA
jgi:hypothetical protein